MLTIIDKNNTLSKYIFPDGTKIIMEDNRIVTPRFIIGDMNKNNSEIITIPDEDMPDEKWEGCKFTFDKKKTKKAQWVKNPKWTDQKDIKDDVDRDIRI